MRQRLSILVVLLAATSCTRLPETFAPPPQHAPLTVAPSSGLGYFLSMSDPQADLYLVHDFQDHGPGTWRWAYSHPVLRFFVPDVPRLRFIMDFSLPERTFRETGPVTLTLRINGAYFDKQIFDKPGPLQYAREVPAGLLRPNAENRVAIDPDPVWVSKADGGRLGFILSRAGFTE